VIDEQGPAAVRFENSGFYKVERVSFLDGDKRAALRIDLAQTYKRLADIVFRFETSAGSFERSCDLSLHIPDARRLGPGWQEGLARARERKIADSNRRPFLYPDPNEQDPRGRKGVYRVHQDLGNFFVSTTNDLPQIGVTANKSGLNCPAGRVEGLVEADNLRAGFVKRAVRESGPVFVGIVSLDSEALRRNAQGQFEARLLRFYLDLIDRLSARPTNGQAWELATFVQRQAEDAGRQVWLNQSSATGQSLFPDPTMRVTIAETLSNFLAMHPNARPISARQIPAMATGLITANGLPQDYGDLSVVMVGASRQGRQSACNDITESMTADFVRWVEGNRRLLVIEFQQPTSNLVATSGDVFQPDRPSEVLRCRITNPKLKDRVAVISIELPDALQQQIRDEVLKRAVEIGQSIFSKGAN
jgi:hypothetical protein